MPDSTTTARPSANSTTPSALDALPAAPDLEHDGTYDDGSPTPEGRRRRRLWAAGLVVALIAGGGTLAVALTGDGAEVDPDAAAATSTRSTATVQERDIVSTTSLAGTLTYEDVRTITAGAAGTITWLPDVGSTVAPGEVLYEVDGAPVVLLPGDLPMWRDLSERSDDGDDIAVLEAALVTLGYADADTLTVDTEFTSATGDAVAALREALGMTEVETLGMGEVVYSSGAVRVAGLDVAVGDRIQSGASVLTGSGTVRLVQVDLDASEQGVLAEGDSVDVALPDGTSVVGTVTSVSPVAEARTTTGQNATTSYVIPVAVTVASGAEGFDEAPVELTVTTDVETGVLAVPVEALLALAEGGYALEVVQPDGSTTLVAVTLGSFSDGWVAVTGDGVTAGTEVISA